MAPMTTISNNITDENLAAEIRIKTCKTGPRRLDETHSNAAARTRPNSQ